MINNTMQMNETLLMLTQWAMVQDGVRAMVLTSTRAIPDAPVDALSDYDVILVVQELGPWVTDHSWLSTFGELLVVFWDQVLPNTEYGIAQSGNVTQYVSGLKLDFTLWPLELFQCIVAAPQLPDELDAGYVVLLDKDALTESMHAASYSAYVPKLPSEDEYQTWINDFLTDPPYVAKCLWRNELFPAKWCLDSDMIQTYLRRLLEWRVAMHYGDAARVGALGKGLKKHLPEDIWAQLEQCFAGAGIQENWIALEHTVALFREVALELGAHLGYRYPEDLHQRVMAYVKEIRTEQF